MQVDNKGYIVLPDKDLIILLDVAGSVSSWSFLSYSKSGEKSKLVGWLLVVGALAPCLTALQCLRLLRTCYLIQARSVLMSNSVIRA